MKNEITAIFMVALIAFGGIGIGVAMPEDIEYMATPGEKAAQYGERLADGKQMLYRAYEADQISKYQLSYMVEHLYTVWSNELVEYTKMYNILNEQIWSTDDGPFYGSVYVTNVAFSIGNSSFSLGPGLVSWYGDEITVELTYFTVTATATAFDEEGQTATLTNVAIVYPNGYTYNAPGIYEVSW